MPKTSKKNSSELIEGDDTGDPSTSTKVYVALNSGGKCCFPDCENHLTNNDTKVSECAHIIPRKVGFVREDWKTTPADRKKADNLIYICSIHHKVIDNPANESRYPANTIRTWKKDHEARVQNNSKNSPNSLKDLEKKFLEKIDILYNDLANETKKSDQLLACLLTECKTLIRRGYLEKAQFLLAQAKVLCSDFNDTGLNAESKILQANLLWKQERIPESKALYLEILGTSDHIEGMLDYISLCNATPEDGDQTEKYEEIAKQIKPDHPRLKLIELDKKYQRREKLDTEIKEEKWTDDDWLNGQFYLTYALLLDLAGDPEKRNHFIDQWEKLLPDSPRPILFRIQFMAVEAYRNGIDNGESALALLEKIEAQEKTIISEGKDPLSSHDRISLLVDKIKVYDGVLHFSIGNQEKLGELRDELFALINDSYFDKHINLLLPEVLITVFINSSQWKGLVSAILISKVEPSIDLIDLIFLQGLRLDIDYIEIRKFVTACSRNDLSDLLDAVEQKNITGIIAAIDDKERKFKLVLFQSINDADLRVELIENVTLNGIDKLCFQIEANEAIGNYKKVIELAKQVELEKVSLSVLRRVNDVAYKYGEKRLTIESGEKILDFDLLTNDNQYRTLLYGKLATSYFNSGDDRNAYKHAAEALKNHDYLEKENTKILIWIVVTTLRRLDKNNEAAEFIEKHVDKIQETPELAIFFAETVLKSARTDKAEKAIEYVTQAFTHAPSNEEKLYLQAYLILNELCDLGTINAENKDAVGDGHFIKIDGVGNTWFYTGEKAVAFSATAINESDSRYQAIIGKSPGDEVEWPADRFSRSTNDKKIAFIFDRGGYFYAKSHEVMQAMAERGDEGICKVEVLNEDGTLNIENLMRFHREKFGNQHEFFQTYCDTALPFAMLCISEGSIEVALSKICSENKGFIRCNNGTTQQLQEQYQVAKQIADGHPFFIDSLTALMLCQVGLLQTIIEKLPKVHVATSVIKTLRDMAEVLRANSSKGRMGFVGGRLHLTERDEESEGQLRQKLIAAANILDDLPNKFIGNVYEKDDDTGIDFDNIFPSWIVDTVRLAQEKGCLVVTDDALSLEAYKIKEGDAPRSTSSLVLIRCLHDHEAITWGQYLHYFRLLSSYRYHLLPVSVGELERTILGVSKNGLVLFTPKNIECLNLKLTLASEYGVEDKMAIRIAVMLLNKIIIRDDITENMADEIFPRVIVGVLAGRDANLWGSAIINICKKLLDDAFISSALAYRKLGLLTQQILRYSKEFNPIIQSVPSLLKIGN